MTKFPARFLGSAIRGSIAGAVAAIVLGQPAAASLLEFTFTSSFDTHTGGGGGSFFLDTSVQAQPLLPPIFPPALYPNAIKNYQYNDPFLSNTLPEANLFVWPNQTPVQGLPSLTEFKVNAGDFSNFGLVLNLANQPSLGFQLSSDPAFYQLNSFWASPVDNSPFEVTSLEVRSVQQVPWPPQLFFLALVTWGAWLILRRRGT